MSSESVTDLVYFDSLLRVAVLGYHDISWFIRPYGNGCQVKGPKPLANLFEHRAVGGVTSKEEAVCFVEDRKPTPQAFASVIPSVAPVLHSNQSMWIHIMTLQNTCVRSKILDTLPIKQS